METRIIFDGSLNPNEVSDSQTFTNGQFLLFDVPGLQTGEGVQLGMSIILKVPIIGKIAEKLLPVTLIERDLSLTLDTNLLFPIPREIGESNLAIYCSFATTESVHLRAYVLTSNVTQESLSNTVESGFSRLEDLITSNNEALETLLKTLLL